MVKMAPNYHSDSPESIEQINLGKIAFENVHLPVFHSWLRLEGKERHSALRDRYIFYSVCYCSSSHIGNLKLTNQLKADEYVNDILGCIEILSMSNFSFNEEWFKGIEQLVGAFTENSYIAEGRKLVSVGLSTGAVRFPRISQTLNVHAAYLDSMIGKRDEAAAFALHLVRRPYLLPNHRELPALCYRLMYILSLSGYLREYRLAIWTGVTHLASNSSLRDAFSSQIIKTYRGALRAMIHGDVPLKYRMLIFISHIPVWICLIPYAKNCYLDRPFRFLYIFILYIFNFLFFKKNELFISANKNEFSSVDNENPNFLGNKKIKNIFLKNKHLINRRILITRAMGGLGDLLMMTPGLQALRIKYPNSEIDFAIPKSFHSLFEGFNAVRLIDINNDLIDMSKYSRWINLTECPSGKIESIQAPNVRRNRIEVFARAMGISKWRLKRTAGFTPFYKVKNDEKTWAEEYIRQINTDGRQVIGIQPFAADSYRNWPYMEELVAKLSQIHRVLVFHHEILDGFNEDHVHKIVQPIRKSIALLARCDKLLVLDSSFLHFSAALGVPTVAIFGAISGRLRTKDYQNVHLLAPNKRDYPCYPCWRHEHKPCHLTNGRESICFRSIKVDHAIGALHKNLPHQRSHRPFVKLFIDWVRYGSQ